jgi:hypothetical protein
VTELFVDTDDAEKAGQVVEPWREIQPCAITIGVVATIDNITAAFFNPPTLRARVLDRST